MSLHWSRLILGILAGVLISLLGLAAIVALAIVFSSAESIQDVQALSRFGFITSVMVGLGAIWGAFIAARPLQARHVLHGLLIGLGIGLLNFAIFDSPVVGHLITLLTTLPAGVLGARLAELNPRRRRA